MKNLVFLITYSAAWMMVCSAVAIEAQYDSQARLPPESSRDGEMPSVKAIFQQHCLRCHNTVQRAGGLDLSSREHAEEGGHSGLKILGTIESSELLRRVRSTTPRYRMPKGAMPLSNHQLIVLEQWIAQGAPWPELDTVEQAQESAAVTSTPWGTEKDEPTVVRSFGGPLRPLGIPLALTLLIVILIEYQKRARFKDVRPKPRFHLVQWLADHARGTHYTIVGLCFTLAAVVLHYRFESAELREQIQRSKNESGRSESETDQSGNSFVSKLYRPHHPRRLGGIYFRGNDERDERLFNGGNYRTARFLLQLVDIDEKVLNWGDVVEQKRVLIKLEIERAPQTTSELFRDAIFEATQIFPAGSGQGDRQQADTPVYFRTIVSGHRWLARFVLDEVAGRGKEKIAGELLVGSSPTDPHYGIEYTLDFVDGKIASTSELWMGAIIEPGRIVVPKPGTIPVNEWFDFLPIPEIEGVNTDDPILLGIPEHMNK